MNSKNNIVRKLRKGFTLIELLVAIGLMTILMTILAMILKSAQEMYDVSRLRAEIIASCRSTLDIIERDMSRLVPLSSDSTRYEFLLRSKGYKPDTDEQELYLKSKYPPVLEDEKEIGPIKKNFIMSFYASTEYYEVETNERKFKVCRIKYYLKERRPDPTTGIQRPGAFLIRRIEPYNYDPINNLFTWEPPIEEDICAYVRGFRVWYMQRDVDLDKVDVRFIEARERAVPPPNKELWFKDLQCVKFMMQQDWVTSLNLFEQKNFLPPAIMVEIHVTDNKAQAYRIAQRIINIDVAPAVLPKKPGQW